MPRALSIRQPWAAAIAHGPKRVENRSWFATYRGPLLLHSSKTLDRTAMRHPLISPILRGLPLETGAVVGVAQLVDWHRDDGECTPWSFPGHHHLVLEEVTPLSLPVPVAQGALQLWTPSEELLEQVRIQLDERWTEALR
ncbi:hypothetical protein [Streptomyces sp. NPDC006925]|uniref:hypothetical protein n=1 Tax=Streptomyces sp. NPDC006925 TaxID=3364768 RepID=UPI0036B22AB0